jgi:hypothetical protein
MQVLEIIVMLRTVYLYGFVDSGRRSSKKVQFVSKIDRGQKKIKILKPAALKYLPIPALACG